jgi:DNA-binding CsgD family transcriptional regulator
VEAGLVGRDRELAELERVADRALRGHGAVMLLTGEPGIGKSALLAEALRRAEQSGVPTARTRAASDDGAPALWPWTRLLADLRAAGQPIPDPTDVAPGPGESPSTFAFRRRDAVSRALLAAARPRGLVLGFEDLQWADDESRRLFTQLAAEASGGRLLLVGTSRPRALDDGGPADHVVLLPVLGLAIPDVAQWLRTESDVDPARAAELQRYTGGNVLFLREVARQLEGADGHLQRPIAELGVPDRIRLMVGHRLRELTPACRVAVGAASVLGDEFDLDVLRAVLSPDVADVMLALEEALVADLVVDDPAAPTRLRFAHALVRAACYDDLDRTARIRWHARIADVLQATDGRPSDIARHRMRAAADPASTRDAVAACTEAARWAIRVRRFDDAVEWARHGLALVPGEESVERDELELTRADGLFRAGRPADALEPCRYLMDRAERAGRGDLAAAAAVMVRGIGPPIAFDVLALCERAEQLLGTAAAPAPARVLAAHAMALVETGRVDDAGEPAAQAMRWAEAADDPDALLDALHARHDVLAKPEHVRERLAIAERVGRLARERPDRTDLTFWAMVWEIEDNLQLGRMDQVAQADRALERMVDQLGWPIAHWHLVSFRAALALLRGRIADAIARNDESAALADSLQDPSAWFIARGFRFEIARYAGYGREAERAMTAISAAAVGGGIPPIGLASMGRHQALSGDIAAARASLAQLAPQLAALPRDVRWLPTLAAASDAAAQLGDLDVARHCYELLAPHASWYLNSAAGIFGCTSYYLGRLAMSLGRLDAAEQHLAQAVAREAAIGAVVNHVAAQVALAQVLTLRRSAGDVKRASELATGAHRTAARHGLSAVTASAQAVLDGLAGRARERAAALTAREREIAILVATGRSNRDVADRLVLSERTVETHVRNALGKLGLGNRTQLAAWAADAGLAEPADEPT